MATVHIPSYMRDRAGGRASIQVAGRTLRQIVAALLAEAPELRELLTNDEGSVRGDISVAIDGVVTENDPTTAIGEDAEIHLVPAIAGGRRGQEL